jgi:transcriptional regulator with XRE-family HTH domain
MARQLGGHHSVDSHLKKAVSERVLQLRLENKLEVSDVVKKLGISWNSYVAIERGEGLPHITALCKIADFYKVSADYLLGRTDERKVK